MASSAPRPEDQELFEGFLVSTAESLDKIEVDILALNAESHDQELINRIFRDLHSIKGAASYLMLPTIVSVSHGGETVLDMVRNDQVKISPAVVELLLNVADLLKECINSVDCGEELDTTEILAQLELASVPGWGEQGPSQDADVVPTRQVGPPAAVPATLTPTKVDGATLPVPDAVAESVNVQGKSANDGAARRKGQDTIRVNLGVLDEIMNLCGEVVLGRNEVQERLRGDPSFELMSKRITELHKHVLKTRMQPIGTLFSRFNRTVRDLGHSLDKSIGLKIEGAEVELDRTIVEALSEPLMHLVRNGCDHAIESPQERLAAGKDQEGYIALRARQESGQVVIEVQDDGRGIDGVRVHDKAISNGLATESELAKLSYSELIRFIFEPGFSTREVATDVSGRGVGMDVVKTAIEAIGGAIEIQSKVGSGTTFTARLPLTLAIASAIIVGCDGRRFAIPQVNVAEIIRLESDAKQRDLRWVGPQRVYDFRGRVIPVLRLSRMLGADTPGEHHGDCVEDPLLLVIDQGQFSFALTVDTLVGAQEIVVKPLPAFMQRASLYSGETVMGDGRIAMILDVGGLADSLGEGAGQSNRLRNTNTYAQRGGGVERQRMILFKVHPDEIFAMPLDLVTQVVKIQAWNIQQIGEQEKVELNGRVIPIIRLESKISVRPLPSERQDLFLIVPARIKRAVGILASQIVGTVLFDGDVDTNSGDPRGLLGLSFFNNQILSVLDVHALVQQGAPDLVVDGSGKPKTGRILLAEDTSFFRQLVVEYLRSAGHTTVLAENGEEALKLAQRSPEDIDLIITDIEMPVMDGWEFIRALKADRKLRNIPVVALTTITPSGDDQRRDRKLFDAYRNKIDRDELIRTVNDLLP